MNAKRFLALQSLFYAFANAIEALVPFLLAPILTRLLDQMEYGMWVLFVTYVAFLRPIVGLTCQDAIRMRFFDLDKQQLDQFTHTILFVTTIITLIGSILVYLFQEYLESVTKFPAPWLISIVIAAFLFEVFYTVLALHQFYERRAAFLYTQIAQAMLSTIFIMIFLGVGLDWRGVILGRMLGLFGAGLISLRTLGYGPASFIKIPPRSFYRNILHFGIFYWPAGMVIMAMAMIDKVVAAHYIGVEASAIYGVAALFASAFWVANHSFVLAWTPWLFRRLKNVSDDGVNDVLSVSAAYFAIATLLASMIFVLSRWVAPVLLGEAFHGAIPLMSYSMIAVLMQAFFFHNMKILHFNKSIVLMSTVSLLALAINVWLSILWVPVSGLKGIMLATAVSYGATFLLSGALVALQVMKHRKGAKVFV